VKWAGPSPQREVPLPLLSQPSVDEHFEQLFHGIFVLVLEFLGIELARFRLNDVRCKVEHILCDLRLGNVVEILFFLPNLIWVAGLPNPTSTIPAKIRTIRIARTTTEWVSNPTGLTPFQFPAKLRRETQSKV
jgi:hypothetical protein